jgi:predicted metalloprotease with PDZ domain
MRPALALLLALTLPTTSAALWAADPAPATTPTTTAPVAAKPFLGIGLDEVDDALAYHLKLDNDLGVMVAEVMPGSAAEKMGVKRYDVIVSCDGQPVYTPRAFTKHIAGRAVGDAVALEVRRGPDTVKLTGTLQARPAQMERCDGMPGSPVQRDPGARQGKVQRPDGSTMEWSIEDEPGK